MHFQLLILFCFYFKSFIYYFTLTPNTQSQWCSNSKVSIFFSYKFNPLLLVNSKLYMFKIIGIISFKPYYV